MRAGLLRQSITITAPGTTQDAFDEPVAADPAFVLNTRASIAAISGKEVYALGAGFTSQISHKIVIRFPSVTIGSDMFVVYGARKFQIQAVMDPDERRRELHLICLELDR